MLKKLTKGFTKSESETDEQGTMERIGSSHVMNRTASYATSGWSRRARRRAAKGMNPDEELVLAKPTNDRGVLNPMNVFDYSLVSRGWPKLILPGCPIPHAIYCVSNRRPTEVATIDVLQPEADDEEPLAPLDERSEKWAEVIAEFYTLHAPEKVPTVHALVRASVDRDVNPSALFAKILSKYGFTPYDWKEIDWGERLRKFFMIHDQARLPSVPALMVQAEEQGDAGMAAAWMLLLDMYRTTEDTWDVLIDWHARYTSFYYIHAPEKVASVADNLQKLKTRNSHPADLWIQMLEKYNVTEDTWWVRPDDYVDWVGRFKAFYSLHAPHQVVKVSEILMTISNKGASPEDVWPGLLKKYGVTEQNWFVTPEPELPAVPVDGAADAAAGGPTPEEERQVWEDKLSRLFAVHSPENVGLVRQLMEEPNLAEVWNEWLSQFAVTEDTWEMPPAAPPLTSASRLAAMTAGVGATVEDAVSADGSASSPTTSATPERRISPRQRRGELLSPLAKVGSQASMALDSSRTTLAPSTTLSARTPAMASPAPPVTPAQPAPVPPTLG